MSFVTTRTRDLYFGQISVSFKATNMNVVVQVSKTIVVSSVGLHIFRLRIRDLKIIGNHVVMLTTRT